MSARASSASSCAAAAALERERALSAFGERLPRRLAERGRVEPGGLGEGERLVVVVGEHLGVVLGAVAGEGREPFRGAPVLLRPLRARDLAVGDVADERVEEGVLRLAGDRGAAVAADELLPLERVQDALVRARQRARPEDLADHRRVLQERLLLRREPVDPRRDQALHRLGQRQVAALVLGEHPRVLLGVERVALGALQHRLLRVGVEHGAVEQPLEEDGGLVVGERADREREGVALAAAPAGPPVEQLRAGRSPTIRSGTVVAQSARWSTKSSSPSSAQWRSSKTSTSGRCSAAASSSRRQAANASSRSARSAPSRPTSGRVWRASHSRSRSSSASASTMRVELLLRRRGVVGLEDPGVRLDDLAERPEAHALAVGKGASLPPGDEVGDRPR